MSNYNPFSLEGKTILVTGASSGIGKETAIQCSKMGATMIVTGRNAERLQETFDALETGAPHKQVIADMTVAEDMKALVKECGKVDGIVLCAGLGMTLPFQFCDTDKLKNIFEINFFSPIELLRQLYKYKQINKGGSVVMIASIGGILSFNPGNGAYGATKAALNSMMKSCAIEFAPRNIRVNSICPGMVETPLIHKGRISEEQMEADMKKYPLKRYGKPEDVAYLAIYLLSSASSWVTGDMIRLDGGVAL